MNSFIEQYYLDDSGVCDSLIDFFKSNKKSHTPGASRPGGSVDTSIKDSTDFTVTLDYFEKVSCLKEYRKGLFGCIEKYKNKYPACDEYVTAWGLCQPVNIQYYKPLGGFKAWHCERVSKRNPNSARHLAFMTYLNTVTDEGGTEFLNQELKISAEKGKTVIWPADWTHTHRGVASPTQEKYIITGWLSFI